MTSSDRIAAPEPLIVPHEITLELYRKMLTVFFVEERMKIFVKQGKCSFNASTRGHEKVQIGMTMLLRPGFDWFLPLLPIEGARDWPGDAAEGRIPGHAQPGRRSEFGRPEHGRALLLALS